MLLEVTVQVGLLAEASITQVALEGFFLVVDVANVTLQVGGDAEGAVAVFTPAGKVEAFYLSNYEMTKRRKNSPNHKAHCYKYNCAA